MPLQANPYSPPSAPPVEIRKPASSYVWYFTGGTVVGIFGSATLFMGIERILTDVQTSPAEFEMVALGALLIGSVVGWLSRDRRPATNPTIQKIVRTAAGLTMGIGPPFFQDLLDWMARSSGTLITGPLSFYRFLMTIVLSVAAAVVLEWLCRRLIVRTRPGTLIDAATD